MSKIFITGGISSGKSSFAEETAVSIYKNIVADSDGLGQNGQVYDALHFVATGKFIRKNENAEADEEMMLKIKKHKEKRPEFFAVHENFEDLNAEIKDIYESLGGREGIILIDSMTLWLASIFKSLSDYDFALGTVLEFSKYLAELKCSVITVTDYIGFNMVPVDAYVRKFVELNGLMEQELSAIADKSYCVIAGNPLLLK